MQYGSVAKQKNACWPSPSSRILAVQAGFSRTRQVPDGVDLSIILQRMRVERPVCGVFGQLAAPGFCGFGVVSGLSGIFTTLAEDRVKVADISCEP